MFQRPLRASATTLVLAAFAAAMPVTQAHADTTVTDAGGRTVAIGDTSRILSIGGDVTEILYALKADGRIIAVDSTSQFPAEALKQKANVGYMRALATEGVLATNPTPHPMPTGEALPVQRLSASAYEDLRRCPYRFFALRQADRDPRENDHPRRLLIKIDRRAAQHQAPCRGGLGDAESEK